MESRFYSESRDNAYSADEILEATNQLENKLGEGLQGAVYRGILRDGTEVAIKALGVVAEDLLEAFETEVRVGCNWRHPNLCILMGYSVKERECFLVYEYLGGGDVAARLANSRNVPFSQEQRLQVLLDTALALSYLMNSKPRVYHRDIKTPNILLDKNGAAKLGDFGLSCLSKRSASIQVKNTAGTLGYADPEYVRTSIVTECSEIYSWSMVALELLTGHAPAIQSRAGVEYLMSRVQNIGSILSMLDQSAAWSPTTAHSLAELVLRCAGPTSQRPSFIEIVKLLRHIQRQSLALTPSHSSSMPHPSQPMHYRANEYDRYFVDDRFMDNRYNGGYRSGSGYQTVDGNYAREEINYVHPAVMTHNVHDYLPLHWPQASPYQAPYVVPDYVHHTPLHCVSQTPPKVESHYRSFSAYPSLPEQSSEPAFYRNEFLDSPSAPYQIRGSSHASYQQTEQRLSSHPSPRHYPAREYHPSPDSKKSTLYVPYEERRTSSTLRRTQPDAQMCERSRNEHNLHREVQCAPTPQGTYRGDSRVKQVSGRHGPRGEGDHWRGVALGDCGQRSWSGGGETYQRDAGLLGRSDLLGDVRQHPPVGNAYSRHAPALAPPGVYAASEGGPLYIRSEEPERSGADDRRPPGHFQAARPSPYNHDSLRRPGKVRPALSASEFLPPEHTFSHKMRYNEGTCARGEEGEAGAPARAYQGSAQPHRQTPPASGRANDAYRTPCANGPTAFRAAPGSIDFRAALTHRQKARCAILPDRAERNIDAEAFSQLSSDSCRSNDRIERQKKPSALPNQHDTYVAHAAELRASGAGRARPTRRSADHVNPDQQPRNQYSENIFPSDRYCARRPPSKTLSPDQLLGPSLTTPDDKVVELADKVGELRSDAACARSTFQRSTKRAQTQPRSDAIVAAPQLTTSSTALTDSSGRMPAPGVAGVLPPCPIPAVAIPRPQCRQGSGFGNDFSSSDSESE